MESTSGGGGGSLEGGPAGSANGNCNMSWSTAARRSSRKAPNRRWGESATRLENGAPGFSAEEQNAATEQRWHPPSNVIKTSASACSMLKDSSTNSSSRDGAKRRKVEHIMDGNATNLSSKKHKRLDTKSYIAQFKTPSKVQLPGVVGKNAKQPSMTTKTKKVKESPFQKLKRLPDGSHHDFGNDHLCAVNKLREFWHKSQGAVFVDDKEIVMKTVLFIMSLLPDVCQPFLVVTTALSFWEAEFKRLAPFINVVVYDGDKDGRKSIQELKFNTNETNMTSHVFLTHPDVILEDIETVQCISWEAVVVEYCQDLVLRLLKQLKQLPTDCRIVLLSSLLEDNPLDYKNLVLFLNPDEEYNEDHVDENDLAILKARFAHHVAYERKGESSKFMEYWIPTYLSTVQLQLYSSVLLTNSSVLQSQVATDSVRTLGDIILCLWKCCDHPCLVDEFQHNSLANIDETESTDNRTPASGKLLLLEKMLREFRNKNSRVIVLFQSDGPGENRIGKILDEFVCHRFGPESYENVQSCSAYSHKQAAMSRFNDMTKGRFVFLIESCACNSNIHLSSIDAVIIYGSDLNPLNDMKALQEIQIESRVEHVNVFRLYTPFTVEEKVLLFAKQGVIIACNIQDLNPSLSHCLLSWGVPFLFSRLDELNQDNPSSSEKGTLCMDKVFSEFLTVLPTNSNCSTISKACTSGEFYSSNITLIGEREGATSLDVDPPTFWLNLLDSKSPYRRYMSEPPQVKHRSLQNMEKVTNCPAGETNKSRRQHRKSGEIAVCSSKFSSDVSNNDVSPEITPSHADPQLLHDSQQKLGVRSMSTPKSLHAQFKCELSKLIKVLELPDTVRFLAEQLLEYLLKNHLLVCEPWGILHAFNIALCWRAASLLKYNKLDRKDSLVLAASCLNYENNEELAVVFYEKLGTLNEKVVHKPGENIVENDMVLSQECPSTNLRNDMFQKQAVDLHDNLTNSSPHERSSGAEQMVSDGQVVTAPEAHRECRFSSGEHHNMIVKKRIDLSDKVFSVREKKIYEKQQVEILDLQKYRENQAMKLKEVCSVIIQHIQRSSVDEGSRNNQKELIVQWFTMLMYAFLEHMRLQLNKLEALQSKTWYKERFIKEKLKEEVVSGQSDTRLDLWTDLPDSNFMIEEFIHFKKRINEYHAGKMLASGCELLLDNRMTMEVTLVRNIDPSEAISTWPMGNEPADALLGPSGASASESVYPPENSNNCSFDGTELQRAYLGTIPGCHNLINQVSNVSSQQRTNTPSRHQLADTESTGLLGTQVEHNMCTDIQPSTSLLDGAPQETFTDDQGQAGCQLNRAIDMSEEGETEYPTHATHNVAALSLSGEAEADNRQNSMLAQQSKSSHTHESLSAFQHPPEAESAGAIGKLPADYLQPSMSVQDQSTEAELAGTLGITAAQDNMQHVMQVSTTTQDVALERADLSGMILTQSPTVLEGVKLSGDSHTESSGTLASIAAPDMRPEIQSSTSMQDGTVEAERSSTSGTIAAQVLQSERQPSDVVQHIPPEGTHPDDMIQISLAGQQSKGLVSQQSAAASWHPSEQEPAGILGMAAADALQPSTMLNQTAEADGAGSLDTGADRCLQTELLPSTTTHDVPCEETDLSDVSVPQGTTSQQSLETSQDTHAERKPDNALSTLAAHDLQSGMQLSSSMQDQPVEADIAGTLDTIAAQDLWPGTQSSTVIHHIMPERTHPDERIQMSLQPNETTSQMNLQPNENHQPNETQNQMSLQPNETQSQMSLQSNVAQHQMSLQPSERPSLQLLSQFFSMEPVAFNHLMYSSEPLRNELEKLKYCNSLLIKSHEQKKLLLQAEYNKEMDKLNRKYESLHHKEDSTYHRMASQLDDIYHKVSMHQLVAENFHKHIKLYAYQDRLASATTEQIPQSSQQAPARTSGIQTAASPVAFLSATRPPVSTSFHSTGPLRSEAIQLQSMLPGNLYRATSSPVSSVPLPNGSYGATGAQLRGPAPHIQQLGMPQPYAAVHRDHQQPPVIAPGLVALRHPAPGTLTSPPAGRAAASIASSSVHQTMPSVSSSPPAFPAPSLLPGSLPELMGNFVLNSSTNPVVMAAQQVSTLSPVPGSALETLPFQQRWQLSPAGAVLPFIVSSSAQPWASNSQAALATSSANPVFMVGQQRPRPNLVFQNNLVPPNESAGNWHTGTHVAGGNLLVPESALMSARSAGMTGEPTNAGGHADVVCLSDDEG